MKHFPLFSSQSVWAAGPILLFFLLFANGCGGGDAPHLDPALIRAESADPGHLLVAGKAGATTGAVLFVIFGEASEPEWEYGRIEQVGADGSFRFVLDLGPGAPLTVWALSSEEPEKATTSSPLVLRSDPSALPELEGHGTAEAGPTLVEAEISLEILDAAHTLVLGAPGAATGARLYSLIGIHERLDPQRARQRPLGADGSFRFVEDLPRGQSVTLWAEGADGSSERLVLTLR